MKLSIFLELPSVALKISILTMTYLMLSLVACTPTGVNQHVEIQGKPVNNTPTGQNGTGGEASYITFDTVKPIFGKFCMDCHGQGKMGASRINWLNYSKAKEFVDNGKLFREIVKTKRMPLAGVPTTKEFTKTERNLLEQWIGNGAYENIASVPADKLNTVDDVVAGPVTDDGGVDVDPVDKEPVEELTLEKVKYDLVQTCTMCHGAMGMSGGGAPHIAELPKEYILRQLKAFSGDFSEITPRTDSDTMKGIVDSIEDPDPSVKDDDVKNFTKEKQLEYLADYYSRLKFTVDDIELDELDEEDSAIYEKGKALAVKGKCLSCHSNVTLPRISGQDNDYIQTSLYAFRKASVTTIPNDLSTLDEGIRINDSMRLVVEKMVLSDEDIEALGLYFSRELNFTSFDLSKLNESNVSNYYNNQCVECHTSEENYVSLNSPILNGLKNSYVKKQLKNFSERKRKDVALGYMPLLMKSLSSDQRGILSKYVSGLDLCTEEPATDVLTVSDDVIAAGAKLFKKCTSCHRSNGSGSGPRIYGQKSSYLKHTIKAFRDKTRKSPLMFGQVKGLTDEQVETLATYVSTLAPCKE